MYIPLYQPNQPLHQPTHLPANTPIYQYVYLPLHLLSYVRINLSTYLPTHLGLCLPFLYLQHAKAGCLDVPSSVHVALHEVHTVFGQTRQQDSFQVARLLHFTGQFVDVSGQLQFGSPGENPVIKSKEKIPNSTCFEGDASSPGRH